MAALAGLEGCARLATLKCEHCRLLADVSALAGCAELRTLNLNSAVPVHGALDLSPLTGCAQLRILSLGLMYRVKNCVFRVFFSVYFRLLGGQI